MKKIRKTSFLLFVLLATQVLGVHAQSSISEKLKETNKMSVTMYEQLIQFVLTQDTVFHNKAMAIVDYQNTTFADLKKNVESGSIYGTLISAYISTGEACKTLYGKYYKDRVVNDNDKTKELKYQDKTYNVSKFRQKEFNSLLSELKDAQKRFK